MVTPPGRQSLSTGRRTHPMAIRPGLREAWFASSQKLKIQRFIVGRRRRMLYFARRPMIFFLKILGYYLWISPKVLLIVLLCVMIRRGLHRQFPMFCAYAALQVVQSAILFLISSRFGFSGPEYHQAYSMTVAASAALRFAVIYELFNDFFRSYPLLVKPGRILLRGGTIVLLLAALGLAVLAPGNGVELLVKATNVLDRTVSILQCGLLLSLLLFSRYFSLSWRSPAVGIALGLGAFASVSFAASSIRLYFGVFSVRGLDLFTMATYHVCVLIWMFYLLRTERATSYVLNPPPSHDLDVWNNELERLVQR